VLASGPGADGKSEPIVARKDETAMSQQQMHPPECVPAVQLHAGDDIVLHVRSSLHGTTACSALDARCGATSIVILTLSSDDGLKATAVVASGSIVTRAAVNAAIGAAA
jgi:hypothetical protein